MFSEHGKVSVRPVCPVCHKLLIYSKACFAHTRILAWRLELVMGIHLDWPLCRCCTTGTRPSTGGRTGRSSSTNRHHAAGWAFPRQPVTNYIMVWRAGTGETAGQCLQAGACLGYRVAVQAVQAGQAGACPGYQVAGQAGQAGQAGACPGYRVAG